MPRSKNKNEDSDQKDGDTDRGESEETTLEDDEDDDEEEEEDSGNDEDFLSEELNLPDTEEEDEETDSVPDYPVIMDDSEEDRIFKRQLSYPPVPMYHPPLATLSGGGSGRGIVAKGGLHRQRNNNVQMHSKKSSSTNSKNGRLTNPRDKIGMLTPMEEVTEPPSSAATSIDGDHRCRSRNSRRAANRNKSYLQQHNHHRQSQVHPSQSNSPFPQQPPPPINSIEQKSILKSRENLQDLGGNRRVTFERGGESANLTSSLPRRRSLSPPESVVSNTSEYSSMADSGRRPTQHNPHQHDFAKSHEIQRTITEETEETEPDPDENNHLNGNSPEAAYQPPLSHAQNSKGNPTPATNTMTNSLGGINAKPVSPSGVGSPVIHNPQKRNSTDLGLISDMEQGEKVIQWQMENAKSESGSSTEGNALSLDSEFASIVNGIIAELHNLDELIGSSTFGGIMEMNASKQDHLANVSTQLATYLAQVSPQTVMTNLPQVIPLVTSLLYLTGSNFRSQLASLTAVNVFIERLRDCKTYSGLRVLPNADLTWLVRALCEISSESSRSVLKNEGVLALARLIKTAGPEMVFHPILFILMGNDEKIRKKRSKDDDEDRIVIPTGGPGGAPKIKAIALDSLTFALLTFPRDDFNLDLVAKLACHCLLHPKRRMRQASLECLAVISHALGSHIAQPIFRQIIMEELAEIKRNTDIDQSNSSISSETSVSGSAPGSGASEAESEPPSKPTLPSKIPVRLSNVNERPEDDASANPISPQKLKPTGSPISAISARISRHLLPQPSLHDLVEYGVKIPASSRILSRQNLIVSKQQEELGSASGGESNESGGSANVNLGRSRVASSSGTSCSSVTNVEIELEPVLNAIGSGRRKQINEVAGSVMAADVAWILNGTGPIKTCDGTSVLAPIYRLPEQTLLVSDMNLTSTHLRQLGMLHSSGMDSDSNVSETFNQKLAQQMRRDSLRANGSPANSLGHLKSNNGQSNDLVSQKILKVYEFIIALTACNRVRH